MMRCASYFPSLYSHRLKRSKVAQAALGLLAASAMSGMAADAMAQTSAPTPSSTDNSPLRLKSNPMLAETPPEADGDAIPIFMFGDRISGRPNLDTTLDGSAELRRGKSSIKADRIEFYQPDDTMTSRGNVRINSAGNQFEGTELKLKIDTFEGYFLQPTYRFLINGGNGAAQRIDFIDQQRLIATQATFTTCERSNEASWSPAWQLTGTSFKFDQEAETGEVTGAVLRFKDVPILAFPVISFPLSSKQ